jgi:hypothetical protein
LKKLFLREQALLYGQVFKYSLEKFEKYKITKNLIIYLAVAPEFEKKGGLYLENCAVSVLKESPEKLYETFSGHLSYVFNPESVEKLWNLSEQILKEHSK